MFKPSGEPAESGRIRQESVRKAPREQRAVIGQGGGRFRVIAPLRFQDLRSQEMEGTEKDGRKAVAVSEELQLKSGNTCNEGGRLSRCEAMAAFEALA